MMADQPDANLLTLTAEIVAAHVAHNRVGRAEPPELIAQVHGALSGLGRAQAQAEELRPAVPIRSSVKPDHIVCLEDGKKLTMLKRYLQSRYGLTPDQYRRKWNLPADYPMVAPDYASRRRELARSIGLGRKSAADSARVTRGRRPKGVA
jgi:predicted transcriptional regulator